MLILQPRWLIKITCCLICILSVVQTGAQNAADSIRINPKKKVAASQTGIASYYHNKFVGRKTANGDIFTQDKMTAANNHYPLNSWVKVTNLSNQKVVFVKITDRMHPKNTRIIDLTTKAAQELRYIQKGLTRVKVEYLGNRRPIEAGEN